MFHFKFSESPDAGLNCCVCLSTMLKPVTLACGHSGCQDCLSTLVATKTLPCCPLCNVLISSGTALNVNIVLNGITAKLDIQCTNTGCEWKGKYEDHMRHSNMCRKLPVKCDNIGCGDTVRREEMAIHISQCQKQEIPCQDCGKGVARDSMGHHVDSLCSHKRIPCPLSCGINLPRCHVVLHLCHCQEKAVQCTVRGCNAIFKRKNEQDHVLNAASTHAVLQEGEVQRLRRLLYFKKTKPTWTLQEGSVFSFCWKASDIKNLTESVRSTEYRVPSGNRWRGLLTIKGSQHHLSLQLVSSVTPVVVGARIVVMPGTVSEKTFSFEAREIKEGQLIGRISSADFFNIVPDGKLTVKYVMSYYTLKEN